MNTNEIPVFFAADKNYLPYLTVAVTSLIANSSAKNNYQINVLTNDLTEEDFKVLKDIETENVKINRVDVNPKIESIKDKLVLRDYYSVSIYFRLFIPSLFPQYKKAIYLDSDIIINRDIADLYNEDLKDNYVAAVPEEVMWSSELFYDYAARALGVAGEKQYFNSGVLVMNLDQFRLHDIENDFYHYFKTYDFGTVAPDQDYLNVTCKDKVHYLEAGWNKEPSGEKLPDDKLYIVHYIMFTKPWRYENVLFEEYFWKYAKMTRYFDELKLQQLNYPEEKRVEDQKAYIRLEEMAKSIANSENNYRKIVLKN